MKSILLIDGLNVYEQTDFFGKFYDVHISRTDDRVKYINVMTKCHLKDIKW